MKLQPHTAPVPDPFFAALRRRRPDVDIVLLPPEQPILTDDLATDEEVHAARDRVAGTVTELWSLLADSEGPGPAVRLTFGPAEGTVQATARAALRTAEGFHLLVQLRHQLESSGWEVRRVAGNLERIAGERDDLTLRASYAEDPGTFLLELACAPYTVGSARARTLVVNG